MATAAKRVQTATRPRSAGPAQLQIAGIDEVTGRTIPPDVAAAVQRILDRAARRALHERQREIRLNRTDEPLALYQLPPG